MDDAHVLRNMSEDPCARRELLWLRAKEKGEDEHARDLEQVDPQITERLRAAGLDAGERSGESPAERRERYGRLWDECYALHAFEMGRRSSR
jgi:hypothetical protein